MSSEAVGEAELTALVLDEDGFATLSAAMDVFCPFEAMGAARVELRHSNFLAYVLDPSRPHGFGESVTRAFLEAVLDGGVPGLSRLHAHLFDLGDVDIRREWRNLDLLLRFPGFSPELVVAVEIKVESEEHGNQLARYEADVRREWPGARHHFVLLTMAGDEPSRETWTAVDFGQILDFVEPVADTGTGHADARQLLAAYCRMIRRRYMSSSELEEIARQLWSRHGPALDFLMARRPDVTRELIETILDRANEIKERIAADTGLHLDDDHCVGGYVRFGVKEWDVVPGLKSSGGYTPTGRLIWFEVNGNRETFAFRMVLGKGDEAYRQDLYCRLGAAPVDGLRTTTALGRTQNTLAVERRRIEPEADVATTADELVDQAVRFAVDWLSVLDRFIRAGHGE